MSERCPLYAIDVLEMFVGFFDRCLMDVRWIVDGCAIGVRWVIDRCSIDYHWILDICSLNVDPNSVEISWKYCFLAYRRRQSARASLKKREK